MPYKEDVGGSSPTRSTRRYGFAIFCWFSSGQRKILETTPTLSLAFACVSEALAEPGTNLRVVRTLLPLRRVTPRTSLTFVRADVEPSHGLHAVDCVCFDDGVAAHSDISGGTKVAALLSEHPELEDLLISMSPAFIKLRNPVLRRSVARIATLREATAVGSSRTSSPAGSVAGRSSRPDVDLDPMG